MWLAGATSPGSRTGISSSAPPASGPASRPAPRRRDRQVPMPVAIAQPYLVLLGAAPDTLIARRHGNAVARAVRRGARRVLRAGGFLPGRGRVLAERLDRDLRPRRPPRNPG